MNSPTLYGELRTGTPAAPGTLILLEGFLNTWSGELEIDDFETAKSTEAWLRSVALWAGSKKLTSGQHQKIVKFRSDLRSWILDKENTQPLNELAAEISFRAEFSAEGEVQFLPTELSDDGVIGMLTKVISESQQDGTWDRFKCCELPTCGWAYYDSTRSRTKRWCSMKTCGSRHKAREYYKRKR
jgi:predicted RNA-binding Zn ribbon-like protein